MQIAGLGREINRITRGRLPAHKRPSRAFATILDIGYNRTFIGCLEPQERPSLSLSFLSLFPPRGSAGEASFHACGKSSDPSTRGHSAHAPFTTTCLALRKPTVYLSILIYPFRSSMRARKDNLIALYALAIKFHAMQRP
jgi:hypothetical protein